MDNVQIPCMNMAPGVFGRDDENAKWKKKSPDTFWRNSFYHAKTSTLENIMIVDMMDKENKMEIRSLADNDFTHVYGWDSFFSGTVPNGRYIGGSSSGSAGSCLQLYEQKDLDGKVSGFFLGSEAAGHDDEMERRWLRSVIGMQFQWTNRNSPRKNHGGLACDKIYLCYMDYEFGILQFAPIIKDKKYAGDHTIIGDDITQLWKGEDKGTPMNQVDGRSTAGGNTRTAAEEANGRIIAYVPNDYAKIIQERKMVLVGMWMAFERGGQGANYDRVWDIFSVKMLFNKENGYSGDSKMLIPKRKMKDALYEGILRLTDERIIDV